MLWRSFVSYQANGSVTSSTWLSDIYHLFYLIPWHKNDFYEFSAPLHTASQPMEGFPDVSNLFKGTPDVDIVIKIHMDLIYKRIHLVAIIFLKLRPNTAKS